MCSILDVKSINIAQNRGQILRSGDDVRHKILGSAGKVVSL